MYKGPSVAVISRDTGKQDRLEAGIFNLGTSAARLPRFSVVELRATSQCRKMPGRIFETGKMDIGPSFVVVLQVQVL